MRISMDDGKDGAKMHTPERSATIVIVVTVPDSRRPYA